jgi:hypothetical protein
LVSRHGSAGSSREFDSPQPEDENLSTLEINWTEIQKSIRIKALRGHKAGLYPSQDLRDVEQELTVYVLERMDRFDPQRGSISTFLKHALKSGIAAIARKSQAACRSLPADKAWEPLDSMVSSPGGPPTQLIQTLTHDDVERRTGVRSKTSSELFELEEDIDSMIDSMPDSQQSICRGLMADGVTKTQKKSGLTRLQFQDAISDVAATMKKGGYTGATKKSERIREHGSPACISNTGGDVATTASTVT